jgi:hypothetical protein
MLGRLAELFLRIASVSLNAKMNANAREPGYLDYLITPPIYTTFSQYTTTSHIRTSTTNKILKH